MPYLGTDPNEGALVQEALRVLQSSDSSAFRSDEADAFFQLAILKSTLARQDAELRAHLLVRQSIATRVNELRELVERHEYRRQRDLSRPPSPVVATSSRVHETTSVPTKEPAVPTSSSKKSLKEWKEEKDKEKSTKGQAAPGKSSETTGEASSSKPTAKVKEGVAKAKPKFTKEPAPEVKAKPKTRAATQSASTKSKGKRRAAPKSKETVSTEEEEVGEEEGEVIENDGDVEMGGTKAGKKRKGERTERKEKRNKMEV